MEREVMWVPWGGELGLEHLHLVQTPDGMVADGMVIGLHEETPFRLHYLIRCDEGWRVREARLTRLPAETAQIHVLTDGEGHWTTRAGDPLAELDGCLDVDISATPFTNTIPIRRLALQPGDVELLTVAYVAAPTMQIRPVTQRYTCLESDEEGALYRYEGIVTNYTTDLEVDEDGLVRDYPDTFMRVWPV